MKLSNEQPIFPPVCQITAGLVINYPLLYCCIPPLTDPLTDPAIDPTTCFPVKNLCQRNLISLRLDLGQATALAGITQMCDSWTVPVHPALAPLQQPLWQIKCHAASFLPQSLIFPPSHPGQPTHPSHPAQHLFTWPTAPAAELASFLSLPFFHFHP